MQLENSMDKPSSISNYIFDLPNPNEFIPKDFDIL